MVNNSNTKAKSRKGTIIKISIAIVSILLIVCIISNVALGFTAIANLSKRNSLSMITQIVPTKNILVLKEFGKTHEQIVDGTLYIKIDEDYTSTLANTKKFEGSLVSNSNIQSSFLVTTQSVDVTGNFGLNSKLSMNLKYVITKQESTISGKFEYCVVTVDLDNNPIVLEAINKDGDKDFYLKISLTDKLIDMFINKMN